MTASSLRQATNERHPRLRQSRRARTTRLVPLAVFVVHVTLTIEIGASARTVLDEHRIADGAPVASGEVIRDTDPAQVEAGATMHMGVKTRPMDALVPEAEEGRGKLR